MDGLPALDLCGAGSFTFLEQYEIINQRGFAKQNRIQDVDKLSDMDHVVTNANSSQCEAQLGNL